MGEGVCLFRYKGLIFNNNPICTTFVIIAFEVNYFSIDVFTVYADIFFKR